MNQNIDYYESVNLNLVTAADPIAGKRVLEIGCAAGGLGAQLKQRGAAYYVGVEYVPQIAELARGRLDQVFTGDIQVMELPLEEGSFDYVIFGDVLEHLTDPWGVLRRCSAFLTPSGQVIASIPNINHATIFAQLLAGSWEYAERGLLDRTHLRFFTLAEIVKLFNSAGLVFDDAVSCRNTNPGLQQLSQDLDALRRKYGLNNDHFLMEAATFQWLIKARRRVST